jgi:hypothetical protein
MWEGAVDDLEACIVELSGGKKKMKKKKKEKKVEVISQSNILALKEVRRRLDKVHYLKSQRTGLVIPSLLDGVV